MEFLESQRHSKRAKKNHAFPAAIEVFFNTILPAEWNEKHVTGQMACAGSALSKSLTPMQ
jgi:hypothetical protein